MAKQELAGDGDKQSPLLNIFQVFFSDANDAKACRGNKLPPKVRERYCFFFSFSFNFFDDSFLTLSPDEARLTQHFTGLFI